MMGKRSFMNYVVPQWQEAWLSGWAGIPKSISHQKYKNGLPLQKGYNLPSWKEKGKAFTGKAGADSDLCAWIREKGAEWFLLTTVTVKSEKEVEKLVQCYAHRWKIERFHFILKSGCKIEKNQAREYGRLSFLTLLYSVIAMQILNLTYLGKICPEISSGIVFVEEEWKVLCCCARKSKEIPESYSLKEAIYDLGVLGGTKGAPSDGMPGVRSIWQGLDVLYSLLAYRNYLV